MILVAEALSSNLAKLSEYESSLSVGGTSELHLYLVNPLSEEEIVLIEQDLQEQAVVLLSAIKQDANILVIEFKESASVLAIMASVIEVPITGWQLFKAQSSIPLWVLVAGGAALGYFMLQLKRVR